ncbi:MAG TPA: GGDEF domain-containing protein [Geminicoccaceae bacterium]
MLTTVMIVVIVVVDFVTGSGLRFAMFYILPVWIAAWNLGLPAGIACALAGAVAGSIANVGMVPPLAPPHPALWIWDVGARLAPLAIVAWLIDKQHAAIARERQLARTDALTGALNRRALLDEATRALARGQRLRLATGFLYLDLDGFKAVNDRHGHAVGDALLVELVAAAERGLRRGDLVGRVGGDEFVLLLAEATAEGAEAAARRICGELRRVLLDGDPPVSFCAGLCLVEPGATQDPARALAEADRMLYAAKRSPEQAEWFGVGRLTAGPAAPHAA